VGYYIDKVVWLSAALFELAYVRRPTRGYTVHMTFVTCLLNLSEYEPLDLCCRVRIPSRAVLFELTKTGAEKSCKLCLKLIRTVQKQSH